jgi:hypothetical protein
MTQSLQTYRSCKASPSRAAQRPCRPARAYSRGLVLALAVAATWSLPAAAAEDYQVRYNMAGSLGGEIFAPPSKAGWGIGGAVTRIEVEKITGSDGKRLKMEVPGGTVAIASAPEAVHPSYGASAATVDAGGSLTIYNVALGYLGEAFSPGQRLAFLVNVPYGRKDQRVSASAPVPALQYPVPGAFSSAQQSAIETQFAATYQQSISAIAEPQNGIVSGLGDIELQGGWLVEDERWRVLTGASVVLPTGRYAGSAAPDIGAGNFYTFRPSVQASYQPIEVIGLAAKLSFGFNTRNRDTDLRSGNWGSLEAALAYKTPLGHLGLHTVYVNQFQDDSGNSLGAARFRSFNAGAFFTTRLPGTRASGLTLQFMQTTSSRYAKSGTFAQIRAIHLF